MGYYLGWHRVMTSMYQNYLGMKKDTPTFPLTKYIPNWRNFNLSSHSIPFPSKNQTWTQAMANHGCLHSLSASTWACKGSHLWWEGFSIDLNSEEWWHLLIKNMSTNIQYPMLWDRSNSSILVAPKNCMFEISSNTKLNTLPAIYGPHFVRFPHPSFGGTICTGQAYSIPKGSIFSYENDIPFIKWTSNMV